MDLSSLLNQLGIPDPEVFVERIHQAVADVYRFNADRHEEGRDDQHTFGFCVYRNSWNEVETVLADVPGVRTARPKNSLEILVAGGFRFHLYRGGDDTSYDIHSFDLDGNSETKASLPANNELQLTLFEQDFLDEEVVDLHELVFVHAGNPRQGLTGLWVGAPRSRTTSGSKWAWVLELYCWSPGDDGTRIVPTGPAIQPFSDLNEPDLDIALHESDERDDAGFAEGAA